MKRTLLSLLLIAVITALPIEALQWNHAGAQNRVKTPSLGIAITPKNFPSHTLADVMEVGWPTAGSGNESEQQAFIGKLPSLLSHVNPSVIAWALLHDVELAEFDANLNSVGLITNNGRKKPGYDAFTNLNNSLKK